MSERMVLRIITERRRVNRDERCRNKGKEKRKTEELVIREIIVVTIPLAVDTPVILKRSG